MTAKRIVSFVLVLASLAVSSLISMDVIASPKWIKLATWGAFVLTTAVAMLPSLFGDALPSLADTAASIGKAAILLLVALPARAQTPDLHQVRPGKIIAHFGDGRLALDGSVSATAPGGDQRAAPTTQTSKVDIGRSTASILVAQASPSSTATAAVPVAAPVAATSTATVPPGAANLTAPVVPPDLDKARAVAALATSTLHQLQTVLGIPQPVLPPAFYETPAGKAIVWTSFALGVACSASGIVLGAVAASKARP